MSNKDQKNKGNSSFLLYYGTSALAFILAMKVYSGFNDLHNDEEIVEEKSSARSEQQQSPANVSNKQRIQTEIETSKTLFKSATNQGDKNTEQPQTDEQTIVIEKPKGILPLRFGDSMTTLTGDEKNLLENSYAPFLANHLTENEGSQFEVLGCASHGGDENENYALSFKRAVHVAEALRDSEPFQGKDIEVIINKAVRRGADGKLTSDWEIARNDDVYAAPIEDCEKIMNSTKPEDLRSAIIKYDPPEKPSTLDID